MKKLFLFFLLISNITYSQIKNFEDESQYLHALQELATQSYTENYGLDDWDGGWRQRLEFDPMSMNLVFLKTPYDEEENGKKDIQWLVKSIIPIYEIDTLIGDNKKNTITIKMKDRKNSIQVYALAPDPQWLGKDYYEAGQENEKIIQSDKLLRIRNLAKRLNWNISELQKFHSKKLDLVNYLNEKLQKEVVYQKEDSLNYQEDKKFKIVQPFQLDSSGQFLSLIVERKNTYGENFTEKQTVKLQDVTEVLKDINIILRTKDNIVQKTTTVKAIKEDKTTSEENFENKSDLFFLQLSHEKQNEHVGSEIVNLFKQFGHNIQKKNWYD